MPKLKTKSGAKKRFKRHNLRKRAKKMKRKARGTFIMTKGDAAHVRGFMPYLRG